MSDPLEAWRRAKSAMHLVVPEPIAKEIIKAADAAIGEAFELGRQEGRKQAEEAEAETNWRFLGFE